MAASQFPGDPNQPQTAQSAIGQFDVRATPLQMAMVAAGIANKGEVMKPYLVQSVKTRGPEDGVGDQAGDAAPGGHPGGREPADRDDGRRGEQRHRQARPDHGVQVAGKTGTAQTSKERPPFAWFTAFAPANDPKVAVAVLIEDANIPRNDIAGGTLGGSDRQEA